MQSSTTTSRAGVWRRRALVGAVTAGLAATALAVAGPVQAAPITPAAFDPSVANQDLKKACGLDVVVVMDASYGVAHEGPAQDQNYSANVRDAALALVSGLKNTNSRVGIVKFNYTAFKSVPMITDDTNQNDPLYFDKNGNGSLAYTINQYPGQVGGNTNWQSAWDAVNTQFASARPGAPKLVVFISDGVPNWNNAMQAAHPNDPLAAQDPLGTAVVNPAVSQANAFKTAGGHVLTVGIGPDFVPAAGALSTAGKNKLAALEAISETTGTEIATPGDTLSDPVTVPNLHAAQADVLLQPVPAQLTTSMKGLATQQCAGSLTVTSQSTNPISALKFQNAVGRATKVTLPAAKTWLKPVAGSFTNESSTSGADGASVYQWDAGAPVTPSVTATIPAGYKLAKVLCTRTNGTGTTAVAVTQTAAFAIPGGVGTGDAVACTVYTYWTKASGILLNPTARTVTYGSTKMIIRGGLRDSTLTGLRGRVVSFYGHKTGARTWTLIRKVTTDRRGNFAVAVAPTQSWQYFASWAGQSRPLITKAASTITAITVNYRVTIGAKRVGTTSKYVLSGAVSPSAKGTRIILQRYVSGRTWTTVATSKVTAKSTYGFTVYKLAAQKIYRVVSSRKLPAYGAGISKNVKL